MSNKTYHENECQKQGYIDVSLCPYDADHSYIDAGLGIKTFSPSDVKLDYYLQTYRTTQVFFFSIFFFKKLKEKNEFLFPNSN